MTEGTDLLKAAASLFNSFTWVQLVPSLTFLAVVLGVLWAIRKAQSNTTNPFDVAEFWREDVGRKLSQKKLLASGCFATHTWFIYSRTVSDKITFDDIVLYCAVWSGSVIFLEALSVWRGKIAPATVAPTSAPPAN
jgi:ammonia channel protein AmtB